MPGQHSLPALVYYILDWKPQPPPFQLLGEQKQTNKQNPQTSSSAGSHCLHPSPTQSPCLGGEEGKVLNCGRWCSWVPGWVPRSFLSSDSSQSVNIVIAVVCCVQRVRTMQNGFPASVFLNSHEIWFGKTICIAFHFALCSILGGNLLLLHWMVPWGLFSLLLKIWSRSWSVYFLCIGIWYDPSLPSENCTSWYVGLERGNCFSLW